MSQYEQFLTDHSPLRVFLSCWSEISGSKLGRASNESPRYNLKRGTRSRIWNRNIQILSRDSCNKILLRVVVVTNRTLDSVMTIRLTTRSEALAPTPDYPRDVNSVPVAPERECCGTAAASLAIHHKIFEDIPSNSASCEEGIVTKQTRGR